MKLFGFPVVIASIPHADFTLGDFSAYMGTERVETSRFHLGKWKARKYESVKICVICGKELEKTLRTMLDELVIFPHPEGCCEVRQEPE